LETDDKMRGLQFDFDLQKKEDEIGLLEKESEIQELTEKRQKNVIWVTGIFLFLLTLLAISLFRRYKFTKETNLIIEKEKDRSENLLLNILPEETAQELKEFGKVKAKRFDSVTVLFTDFVGFTAYAKNLEPEELVSSVDYYFSKFDAIMEKYDVEKIKTIGDAYMCVSGLPEPGENDALRAVQAAFEILDFMEESKKTTMNDIAKFDIRIGINTGPVVAGIVGTKKFAYDVWGDAVNVASRMESKSEAGKINVSESTYNLIKEHYDCEFRGEIDVKNKGMMKMFFVNAKKKELSS
jgi:class 3 adenylate cyclase